MEEFGRVLASCALNVASGEFSLKPGRIIPDVVEMYLPDVSMKHALFVAPFLWDAEFTPISGDHETVVWSMAVPVSQSEFEFARREGSEELEGLLERCQIRDATGTADGTLRIFWEERGHVLEIFEVLAAAGPIALDPGAVGRVSAVVPRAVRFSSRSRKDRDAFGGSIVPLGQRRRGEGGGATRVGPEPLNVGNSACWALVEA